MWDWQRKSKIAEIKVITAQILRTVCGFAPTNTKVCETLFCDFIWKLQACDAAGSVRAQKR